MATTIKVKKTNVSKNPKKEIPFNLHTIILSAIYIIFLFCYGGFHETPIVIAGIIVFAALWLKKGIRITAKIDSLEPGKLVLFICNSKP